MPADQEGATPSTSGSTAASGGGDFQGHVELHPVSSEREQVHDLKDHLASHEFSRDRRRSLDEHSMALSEMEESGSSGLLSVLRRLCSGPRPSDSRDVEMGAGSSSSGGPQRVSSRESHPKVYNMLLRFLCDLGISEHIAANYAVSLSRPQYRIRRISDLRKLDGAALKRAGVNVRLHRTMIITAFPRDDSREGRVTWILLLLWWFVIIAWGTIYQRLLCLANIPDDCVEIDTDDARFNVVNTILLLIDKAVITFVFARINLYKLKQVHFYVIYLGAIPLFGYLGHIYPDIQFNSSSAQGVASDVQTRHIILLVVVVVVAGSLVIHHLYLASRLSRFSLSLYLISLVLITAIGAALYGYISQSHGFYLHHWYAFWLLTLFTRFDDFFSVGALAFCLGVFVQGAASYGAAVVPFV